MRACGQDEDGRMIFPATVIGVNLDGSLRLQYDHNLGEGFDTSDQGAC